MALAHLDRAGAGPGAAPQADAGLRGRLQADPAVERVLPRPPAAQRRAGHRGRGRGAPPRCRHRRRPRARGRHDRLRAPASRSARCRPPSRSAAAAAGCSATSGKRAACRPCAARRSRASPTSSCSIGPNTGLGHNSIVFMIESQLTYAMDALRAMDERGAAVVDTRPEAQAAFNEEPSAEDARHRLGRGRLRQLVPRRARPQHDPLARHLMELPAGDEALRPSRARARVRPAGSGFPSRALRRSTSSPAPSPCRSAPSRAAGW